MVVKKRKVSYQMRVDSDDYDEAVRLAAVFKSSKSIIARRGLKLEIKRLQEKEQQS